ncbi:MAG: CoA transferase [Spirochaetaceae bacterium]|nr:CoA transferase [Spirochaetaceae bacterium]
MAAASPPLSGITVLDLTRVLAGPYCTMVLRDLGAEVIKVEPPQGDEARGFGPFLAGGDGGGRGESAYFTSLNCGKRSVVLDLKEEPGSSALAGLIRRADVLVENFRPGTLAKLGFPADRLLALNPRLVYAAISGFGATGPAAQRPAYDMIIQALSGLMSITGTEPVAPAGAAPDPAGGAETPIAARSVSAPAAGSPRPHPEPPPPGVRQGAAPMSREEPVTAAASAPPQSPHSGSAAHGQRVRVGTSIADIVSGLYAAVGIVAALAQRARTGRGAVLDLGMLDATVSVLENAVARYQVTGAVPAPLGTRHPSITPFEAYATADQEIVVAAGNDRLFASLCAVVGRRDLPADRRFAGNAARNEHVAALKEELESALRRHPGAHWLERLAAAGVPAAPVNTIADLFDDPQIAARGMLVPVAGLDRFLVPGSPLKFAGAAAEGQRPPAPRLGEHTAEVLAELASEPAATVSED